MMNDAEKPKLNIERIREVANTIEANSDKFNMETYFSDCGTPSCIAGWVVKKPLIRLKMRFWTRPKRPWASLTTKPLTFLCLHSHLQTTRQSAAHQAT